MRLWAKLQSLESTLSFLEAHWREQQKSVLIANLIQHLHTRLEQARRCLREHGGRLHLPLDSNTRFWALVHGISADLLLIMPLEMLASEAMMVEENFRRNIQDPIARGVWLGPDEKTGPLCSAVRFISELALRPEAPRPEEEAKSRHARHVLRGALRHVQKHSDRYFHQLELTMLIRTMSGALLVLLFILAQVLHLPARFAALVLVSPVELPWGAQPLGVLSLILLGMGGSIMANILSEKPVLVVRGPNWRQFVYYLFIKPSLGAVAAFLFHLLAVSQLFFSIELLNPVAELQAQQQFQPALRIVLASNEALVGAYTLLLIAVGFSAERLLSPIMDKVMNRLFITAEKTEPSPGTTPSGTALQAPRQPALAEEPEPEFLDAPRRAEQGASG